MPTAVETAKNIGVINPYALAEVVLKRRVNWKRVASPAALLEKTLRQKYDELFDPKHESPLYSGLKLHNPAMTMEKVEAKAVPMGVPVEVGNTVWVDPGEFIEEGTNLTDPVQGALGDCYFIAALSAVAWSRPYVVAQRTRVVKSQPANDFFDMIEFFKDGDRQRLR